MLKKIDDEFLLEQIDSYTDTFVNKILEVVNEIDSNSELSGYYKFAVSFNGMLGAVITIMKSYGMSDDEIIKLLQATIEDINSKRKH